MKRHAPEQFILPMWEPHQDRNLPFINQPLIPYQRGPRDLIAPLIHAGASVVYNNLPGIPNTETLVHAVPAVASYIVGLVSTQNKRQKTNSVGGRTRVVLMVDHGRTVQRFPNRFVCY